MKYVWTLVGFSLAVSIPQVATSQAYRESYECVFRKGVANRPTPTRVVFSVDGYGQSALLHTVEMPGIDTPKRSASIGRNSSRVLSFSWPGDTYTFSNTGRRLRAGDPRRKILDLGRQEFSLYLNRETMQARTRSKSSGQTTQDGNAKGNCKPIKLTQTQ